MLNSMPYKDPQKQKQYVAERGRRRKDLTTNAKKGKPCSDCGIVYPTYVTHFDHRPGEEKVERLNALRMRASKAAVLAEIAKCDLVCANCHAERTHRRLQAP